MNFASIDVVTIERWVNLFGIPVVMLFSTAFAFWRTITWIAPRVDKVVNAHVLFIERVGTTQQEIVETQREIAAGNATILQMLQGQNHIS